MNRITISILILASAGLLQACGGPTKAGLKARSAAGERMSMFRSRVGYEQAEQSLNAGRFDRAEKEITSAILQTPEIPKYHVLLGRVYMETKRLEKAVECFDTAIEIDEKTADAHYYRGVVHQRWSEEAAALEDYMAAYEVDKSKVSYLLAAGEMMIEMGNYDRVKDLVIPQLSYFEHNAALHQLLGHVSMLENDPLLASDYFERAVLLSDEDDLLLHECARAQFEAGRYSQCLLNLRKLSQRSEKQSLELILAEARCLVEMGRLREARNAYVELTRLNPEDVDSWVGLGIVAHLINDYRRLDSCADHIIAIAPGRYEGWFFRALCARQDGDVDLAINLLAQSIQHCENDDLAPRLVLGMLMQETGQDDKAFRAYAEILRMHPDQDQARQLISVVDLD